MIRVTSTLAVVAALALSVTGCTAGDPTLTLSRAKEVIKTSGIACESQDSQKLGDVIPQNDGEPVAGDVLFCSDEGETFGMGIFEDPSDIRGYIDQVCKQATDDAAKQQLKEYEMLWGPNWFADASANPDLLPKLQDAFGGELADFYSKC